MRQLIALFRKREIAQVVDQDCLPRSVTPALVPKACSEDDNSRIISLGISEDIERRLQEDLAKGLSTLHDIPTRLSSDSDATSEGSLNAPERVVDPRNNFPVRLMDTSDIVTYLATQRQQARSTEKCASSRCRLDSLENNKTCLDMVRPKTQVANIRQYCAIGTYAIVILLVAGLLAAALTWRQVVQADFAGAHVEWHKLHFDQINPASARLRACGTLGSISFHGVLRSATYEVTSSEDVNVKYSDLRLPEISFGNSETYFEIEQVVHFSSPQVSSLFFQAIGNQSQPFNLKGSAIVSRNRVTTRIHLPSLPTTTNLSFTNSVQIAPVNIFSLTISPDADMLIFRTNITVDNHSSTILSLGAIGLQLSSGDEKLMIIESLEARLEAGSNLWHMEGAIPNNACHNCTSSYSAMLSLLLSRKQVQTRVTVLPSVIGEKQISYLAPLVQSVLHGLSFQNADSMPNVYFSCSDTVLYRFSDSQMSLALSVVVRIIYPYDLQQEVSGLTIDTISISSSKGSVMATRRTSFELEGIQWSRSVDGSDGSRSYSNISPITLDVISRPALANAMVMQENDLQDSQMHAFGTFTAHIETTAGLIRAENLVFNSSIHIRDPLKRTTIVGYDQ